MRLSFLIWIEQVVEEIEEDCVTIGCSTQPQFCRRLALAGIPIRQEGRIFKAHS